MNWSRVRWFLIICLCLADLLLGFLLWRNDRGINTVSRAAIEDAAALLAETDVRLDADTVPTAVVREHVFRIPVSDAAYRTAYSAMVGSTVAGAYLLPASTGVSLLFENGDTVEYYHNLYLLYVRDGADRDRYETLLENLSANGTDLVPTDATLAEMDAQAAYDFLLGLTPSGSSGESTGVRLRPRLTAFYTAADDEGLHLAVYREEILYRSAARNAAEIYDTEMHILIRDGTVLYMSGTWVPCMPDETYRVKTLDQLNILFSERMRHMTLDREGQDEGLGHAAQHTDAGCEIASMQRVYYMLWDDAGMLYLRPSWLLDYRLEVQPQVPIRRDVLCDSITGNVVRQTEQTISTADNRQDAS